MIDTEDKTYIDLTKYRGDASTSFTGRPEGRSARSELMLDQKDQDGLKYIVKIPVNTSALNPSFYLGLFFDSIKTLGVNSFEEKYVIQYDSKESPDKVRIISRDISEGKRHAINQLESDSKGRGGLFRFFANKVR